VQATNASVRGTLDVSLALLLVFCHEHRGTKQRPVGQLFAGVKIVIMVFFFSNYIPWAYNSMAGMIALAVNWEFQVVSLVAMSNF
jgi:hypothetical protein